MCEPNTKTNPSAEDKSTNSDDEIFLDANDEINIPEIYPDVIQVNNCSGRKFIDLKTLPTNSKPKRIINDSFIVDEPYELLPEGRQELPSRNPPTQISVWSIIKEFVGKDLTKVTLPVTLNEPTSALQRFPEVFTYPEPLKQMVQPNIDPISRLELIGAHYAISQSSHSYRFYKPFNPILGETYELRNDEKGFVFVSEQVSHHPPIAAMQFQLPNLRGYGSVQIHLKFWGNSCDAIVEGGWTYEFLDSNGNVETVITFATPVSTGRNIIFG